VRFLRRAARRVALFQRRAQRREADALLRLARVQLPLQRRRVPG